MKLKIKDAKKSTVLLVAGLLILYSGALLPDALFKLKIGLFAAGFVLTWAVVIRAIIHFRCPHCRKSYIPPLWKAERFCPCCGQKIEWE